MHPFFTESMLRDNQRDLDRRLRAAGRRRGSATAAAPRTEPVLLRLSTVGDDDALGRLAQLEGRSAPMGSYVVAEVEGRVVAALPFGAGSALADPFRPTAHLMPLLELRADQLSGEPPGRRAPWAWSVVWRWSRA